LNLVDSSGWLEYFANGKNAEFFAPIIEDNDNLIVSTINIYEVFKKILIEKDENSAIQAIGLMQQGKVIDISAGIAIHGARMSHDLKIPMADSLILASAKHYDAILWTEDADFKGMEGVKYFKKTRT
jgi:predicted nucleic acid-binding protein